ncbi:hypothetical protein ASA1KI_03640 [Opitutales bacterium ASA1]|nr:hypothetical protein ASA1KI_03640 [Opitutales bacterium ASA1]
MGKAAENNPSDMRAGTATFSVEIRPLGFLPARKKEFKVPLDQACDWDGLFDTTWRCGEWKWRFSVDLRTFEVFDLSRESGNRKEDFAVSSVHTEHDDGTIIERGFYSATLKIPDCIVVSYRGLSGADETLRLAIDDHDSID